ncbi:hypothetical protein GPJ56_009479 [Histomonas meleagridis]|uniref:uncharacterized protein n=1 Tax=Histomonas meleagridis TaxID=135588 RepID=UPI0035595FB0|nr:hypothetical protein GPJ56_009479 [Histomonas meleagridis]KAH0804620.1 hypothetical protein GO595_002556 [Histomonas meleagridis]
MSLQNLNNKEDFTYESLSLRINALNKQVAKTKEVANELEEVDDVRKNIRLQRTQNDNNVKFKTYMSAFKKLKKDDPDNPLESTIDSQLDSLKRTLEQINKQIKPIGDRHKILEEQQKEAAEEQKQIEAEQLKKSAAQLEEEQMAADREFLQNQLNDIAETAAIINEGTHQVDNQITADHEKVVHIDQTIEEAKQEMIEGNKDLEVAEADQKAAGCGCACNIY